MKTRPLKNYYGSVGCEVYDIDLATATDEEIMELGKVVEDQLTVFIGQECLKGVDKKRRAEIHRAWGSTERALLHEYIQQFDVKPDHWKDITDYMTRIAANCPNREAKVANMGTISFSTTDNGPVPRGMFTTPSKLDWHSDQAALNLPHRINGLASESGSVGSRTDFLQTFDVWEEMSSDMQSMVKELVVRHKFNGDAISYGGPAVERELVRLNMCPVDGLEGPLYNETSSGRPGIKFPSFTFNGFVGMSDLESWKLYAELAKLVYDPRFVYQHEWQDGQWMFFDQSISLHRRPTLAAASPNRYMIRTVSHTDRLYPNQAKPEMFRVNGKDLTVKEFCELVDKNKAQEYQNKQ